ncbi:hypothetical protein [Arthrobacter sp. D3-16]
MKRAITTLGVLGLAAFAVAAPAVADRGSDDDKIAICHAGSGSNSGHFTMNMVALPGLNGHDNHPADIIPPNDGLKYGQNWDDAGRAIHGNGCVILPVVDKPVDNPPVAHPPVDNPPVVHPPVDNPPVVHPPVDNPPVVHPPVDNPPVEIPPVNPPAVQLPVVVPEQPGTVQPQVRAPQRAAAAPVAKATAASSLGTNQGYNAQTAVGGPDSAPSWLAGLGALLAAAAAVAFRRKSRTLPLAG